MANKINIADIQALIAFAIQNNKQGVINVMNASGYPVSSNISDSDLFDAVGKVGDNHGMKALENILSKVTIDKSKLTQEQAKNLAIKFQGIDPNAKFSDWFGKLSTQIGDFFSGNTVVNQNPNVQTQNSEPEVSPYIIISVALVGIVAIVWLQMKETKGATNASWAVGAVTIVVLLYGIFAKKQTITASGGGGSQNIHNGALGWLAGILNGLSINVVGK